MAGIARPPRRHRRGLTLARLRPGDQKCGVEPDWAASLQLLAQEQEFGAQAAAVLLGEKGR